METIEIQFHGYEPQKRSYPIVDSPFERVQSADEADTIIWNTLMGDADDEGWCHGDAEDEDFQVRWCDVD